MKTFFKIYENLILIYTNMTQYRYMTAKLYINGIRKYVFTHVQKQLYAYT